MKSIILIILLTVGLVITAQALPPLPPCYHSYAEITAELLQLQSQYPNIAKVYTIGYSQQDNLPIYAMKISDNVIAEETEPAVLLVGQVHAEEVLGVETTMSNIKEILTNSQDSQYQAWISQLEMWFIPTLNPEGHNVVTSNIDVSYRKNKHDVNNNGIFDPPNPLVGYDTDGVDINRNFAFNWCHGDTLLQPGGTEVYDYYRGEAPMSESENQAFKAFCDIQKPVFSIVWHSSRTGLLSETVYYPMNWYAVRPAPDLDLGLQIGQGVASQIHKVAGGTYDYYAAEGRKGGLNDWMYQQYGTICLIIECGTSDMQPDSLDTETGSGMFTLVSRNTLGVWWLLNRALLVSQNVPSSSMLTGTIKDAVTGLPLEAEIIIEQKKAPWFAPRKSDPVTGRFWRPVTFGNYEVRYRKKGYFDNVVPHQYVNDYAWTIIPAINLQPRPPATISGTVRNSDNNQLLPARIVLYDLENDTLQTSGEFDLDTFEGSHRIEITAEGFYPYINILEIAPGVHNLNLDVTLTPANIVFSENWENGTGNWTIEGLWVVQNQLAASGSAITDSWGGRGFYAQDCNVWIQPINPIILPDVESQMLTFDEHLYTEFVYDSVRVEISANNADWQTIYSNSGQYDWWHPVYIPLTGLQGSSFLYRFRLTDQSSHLDLTDPGWTIDNIKVVSGYSNASITPNSDETIPTQPLAILYPNFPNPFNPETTIKFGTNKDINVTIDIYNLKGQKVRQLTNELYNKGTHQLKWNGLDDNNKPVSSGIYFCKMHSGTKIQTLKMVLMK